MTTARTSSVPLDESKLNAFFGRVLDDWGGTLGSALVVIGDKLGLYEALRRPAAERRGAGERERAPTRAMSASGCSIRPPAGYVTYDPTT